MPDADNILLTRISKSLKSIEKSLGVVQFPEAQPVEVESIPPVEVSTIPPVEILTAPPIEVVSLPPVEIATAPSIEISSLPPVEVSTLPAVSVNNFPATQPVSVAALPLPAGAATETTLAAILAKLSQTNYGKTVNYFSLAQVAPGNIVIAAASPGNRHKVVGFLISAGGAAATVQFLSNATPLTGQIDIMIRGNVQDPVSVLEPSFQTATGEALSLTSVGNPAKGFVVFLSEP